MSTIVIVDTSVLLNTLDVPGRNESRAEVLGWLDAFPDAAMQGLGMGDLSIKKEWEDLCAKYSMSRVRVWTLDVDLAGLDRAAKVHRRPV